jgi:hypothetical protein
MVRSRLCKLQEECILDKVYQLLANGRWFSPGTPASSTTKAGRHDITEILMKVALSTINQIKSIAYKCRNMVLAIQSKTLSSSFRIHDLSVSL